MSERCNGAVLCTFVVDCTVKVDPPARHSPVDFSWWLWSSVAPNYVPVNPAKASM